MRSLFVLVYVILGITLIIPLIFTAIFYNYLFGFRCERTTSCSRMNMYPDLIKHKMDFYSGKTLLDAACYSNKNIENKNKLMVFCHGIGCGKDNYLNRIDYFTKKGYLVFAYDMTGVCDSGGKGQRGVPQSTLDLKFALDFVHSQKEFDGMPIVVYGHSLCGFACSSVLNYGDFDIKAMVTCGGFNTSSDISRIYVNKFMGKIVNLVIPYVAIVEFLRFGRVARFKSITGINKFGRPTFIMHSKDDTTIPYEDSIVALQDKCTNPNAEFFTYLDRGHTLSRPVENEDKVKLSFASIEKIRERHKGESYFRHNIDTHYQMADFGDIYKLDEEFMQKVCDFYDRALLENCD